MLLFAMLTVLSPSLRGAQAADDVQARRARLLALILEYGEAEFRNMPGPGPDAPPAGAYLEAMGGGRPTVPRGALEYAAALLTADLLPQCADGIVNDVLATQAPPGAGKQAGAFPWQRGSEPDPAATAYVAPWLAYIHRELKEKLPAQTQARLAASLQPALKAVGRLRVTPAETGLFLMKAGAEAMLARELEGEARPARSGTAADLAAWTKFTQENGIPEAQSPSYSVDAVAGLNWVWIAAPDEETRAAAGAGLEYLHHDLALRYHPKSAMVAGAAVRAFPRDYITGMSASQYLLYAQYGRPELGSAPPFAMFLTLPGFVPGDGSQAAATLDVPRTVASRVPGRTSTTYLDPQFSLGTMSGEVVSGTVPVLLTFPEGTRPTAYCVVQPLPARVAAVQEGARALVSFDFDDIGYDPARVRAGVEVHLGTEDVIDRVLVNQTPYTADYAVAVPTKSSAVIDRDGVFTSITVVAHGPAVPQEEEASPRPAVLEWVAGDEGAPRELIVRVQARDANSRQLARGNYRVALAVEMASRASFRTLEEFASHIYETRTGAEVKAKRVKVGEKVEGADLVPGNRRPVERARWIFDYLVLQTLQYQSGDDVLALTEDLEQNETVSRTVNGVEQAWDFLYRSPSLNHVPGDALDSVLRPPPLPPPPEPAPEESAG